MDTVSICRIFEKISARRQPAATPLTRGPESDVTDSFLFLTSCPTANFSLFSFQRKTGTISFSPLRLPPAADGIRKEEKGVLPAGANSIKKSVSTSLASSRPELYQKGY
jgi:hypothetical protein